MNNNICALCKHREATKTNTHYLSDAIIRRALNEDGSNIRAKSLNFDLSPSSESVDFKFGQKTSIPKLDEIHGRPVTEEEIEKAKKVEFSVDNVFCPSCEDIFTSIEDRFYKEVLPKFRDAELGEKNHLELDDCELVRLFFYLQFWRTHIATGKLPLAVDTVEMMRTSILNQSDMDSELFYDLPIHIAFLETLGEDKEYTKNTVGFDGSGIPRILMMNDFMIRLYEVGDPVVFTSHHGLYKEGTYLQMVNTGKDDMKVEIISNDRRKKVAERYAGNEIGDEIVQKWVVGLVSRCKDLNMKEPNEQQMYKFVQHIVFSGDEALELRYTPQVVQAKTDEFLELIKEGKV